MDCKKDELLKGHENLLSIIWGNIFKYNLQLNKLSENEEFFGKENFGNIIDFYLTSHALSFLKNILLDNFQSQGIFLSARCFLEGLALKRMYQKGKITDLQIELLKKQVHIIEFNYYKDFKDISETILIPEKIIKDYEDSKSFFINKLSNEYKENDIEKFLKSDIPFLCVKRANHRRTIEEYLGKDFSQLYGLFSQVIHPSANNTHSNEELQNYLFMILSLIIDEYKTLQISNLDFSLYKNNIYESKTSKEYLDIVKRERDCLNEIVNEFQNKFGNNYVSNTLKSISVLIDDMCSDKLLGLCESVKSKWKVVLELFSFFPKCYDGIKEERYKLLCEHQRYQVYRNVGKDYSLDDAYKYYKNLYVNGVDKQKFKNGFESLVGFLIDENGKSENITKIVKEYTSRFSPNDEKITFGWDRAMILNYVESQMVSHANGYLWYANSGSWGDINSVIIGTDICLIWMFNHILQIYQLHKAIEQSDAYIRIINCLESGIKTIKLLIPEKEKNFKAPAVKL